MYILITTLSFILLTVIYFISFTYYKITISLKLVKKAVPYSIKGKDSTNTLLVLGDSTAVGVGSSTSSDSVPARLAKYLGSTYIENLAVSGAIVDDLPKQIKSISKDHYDTILIQIGANDIIRFHDIKVVSSKLEKLLLSLKQKSNNIIFISAGNIGGAPLIPPPLRPFYTRLNLKYHKSFENLGNKNGITYINMYMEPNVDPFIQNPKDSFAEDSFHPSSLGYEVWFNIIKTKLNKQ